MLFGCITVLPEAAASTGLVTFGSYGWLFEGLAAQEFAMLVVVPFSAAEPRRRCTCRCGWRRKGWTSRWLPMQRSGRGRDRRRLGRQGLDVAGLCATTHRPRYGPVDQDPEQIRNEACKVVSSDSSTCVTTTTVQPRTSSGRGATNLSFLSLLLWLLLIAAVVAVVVLLLRRPLARAAPRQ